MTVQAPLARLSPDSGLPMWQQIDLLFQRFNIAAPPYQLRDELVTILMWARYGEALTAQPPVQQTVEKSRDQDKQ